MPPEVCDVCRVADRPPSGSDHALCGPERRDDLPLESRKCASPARRKISGIGIPARCSISASVS